VTGFGFGHDAMAQTSATQQRSKRASGNTAIHPFHVNVRNRTDRIAQAHKRDNWPERETVKDALQSMQLATSQALARLLGDRLRRARSERN
jgi:hypothetical protein